METEATYQTNGENINIDGGYMTKFNAPYLLVTPSSKQAVKMLQENCACGDESLWSLNEKRRLTTCSLEECNVDFWNNVTLGGGTFHGNMLSVVRNDSVPELRHTPVVETPFQAKSQTENDLGNPFTLSAGTCNYPYDSVLEICGTWELKCHATLAGDMEMSTKITGSAGDASQGEGTGLIKRERLMFHHGSACGSEPFAMINDEGFWSDLGNSTTVPGARNILVRFITTEVELFD